jgi:hypothetical protein
MCDDKDAYSTSHSYSHSYSYSHSHSHAYSYTYSYAYSHSYSYSYSDWRTKVSNTSTVARSGAGGSHEDEPTFDCGIHRC